MDCPSLRWKRPLLAPKPFWVLLGSSPGPAAGGDFPSLRPGVLPFLSPLGLGHSQCSAR